VIMKTLRDMGAIKFYSPRADLLESALPKWPDTTDFALLGRELLFDEDWEDEIKQLKKKGKDREPKLATAENVDQWFSELPKLDYGGRFVLRLLHAVVNKHGQPNPAKFNQSRSLLVCTM